MADAGEQHGLRNLDRKHWRQAEQEELDQAATTAAIVNMGFTFQAPEEMLYNVITTMSMPATSTGTSSKSTASMFSILRWPMLVLFLPISKEFLGLRTFLEIWHGFVPFKGNYRLHDELAPDLL